MEVAVWRAYSEGGSRASTQRLRISLYRDATALIRAELDGPLTLEQVARRVAASPRQLRRVFAEVGDTSFRSYVVGVRMRRAAELLADTELPAAEVGRRVGYRQPSQFSKAFKRAFGTTPSGYRGARRG